MGISAPRKALQFIDMEHLEDESSSSGNESDGTGEYAQRPKKRPKNKKMASTRRKGYAAVPSHFMSIPLDILLEIASHARPSELLALARTNRILRQVLMSRKSETTWKAAREKIGGPECPPDLSEPFWADLLFGGMKCQFCAASGVQRIDFGLRLRACTLCLKKNLVVTSSFAKRFPDFDKSILDLLPYTHVGGFAHGHASSSNFYWKADIEEMAKKMAVLVHNVYMCKPGAKKQLDEFKKKQSSHAKDIVKNVGTYGIWAYGQASERRSETQDRKERRYEAIKSKFMALGYAELDIRCIYDEKEVQQPSQLSEKIWKRIYPILEPAVQAEQASRLAQERKAVISTRMTLASTVYEAYKKSLLVPLQSLALPGAFEVCHSPVIEPLINAANDFEVKEPILKAALLGGLPAWLPTWTVQKKAELCQMIDSARGLNTGPIPLVAASGSSGTVMNGAASNSSIQGAEDGEIVEPPTPPQASIRGVECLHLATAVFTCGRECFSGYRGSRAEPDLALIAWDGAVAHQCVEKNGIIYLPPRPQTPVQTILQFSERGSATVAALIAHAGLDAYSATPMDVDQVDLRFLCLGCIPKRNVKTHDHQTYTWRRAVSHFIAADASHASPQFHKLDPAETLKVKTEEGPHWYEKSRLWSCNHCSEHVGDGKPWGTVQDHLKTKHAIANPSVPGDLFNVGVNTDDPVLPVVFRIPAEYKYRCKQCPANSTRSFQLDGVKRHINDKHKIRNPVHGNDFIEFS